jgi:ABC-type transport system substrate-binding protein
MTKPRAQSPGSIQTPKMRSKRRVVRALVTGLSLLVAFAAAAADPAKVLHVASPDIDTLDPQQYADSPSFDIQRAIFEPLYEYDYLAASATIAPCTATALPVITDEGRTWTMHVRPGIYFTPDPAFKGKPRELVAEDYVYAYERWIDPNLRRGGDVLVTDLIVGARAAVDAARKPGGHFDYAARIEGLQAIDRYTVQLKLTDAVFPPIVTLLAVAAGAREVLEAAGAESRTRAVGTGPYRLAEWKQGSRIVLAANPGYRKISFPATTNPRYAELSKKMAGKTFPQIGEVDIDIITEDLPLVLEFERGKLDYIRLYSQIANRLLTANAVRADLAAKGVQRFATPEPYVFSFYLNIDDPVVGGMAKERIALRRAVELAIDVKEMIAVLFGGQAMPARQFVAPGVGGHDPALDETPLYDPVAAGALLDHFGYTKRDSEGFRLTPDGKPLTLVWLLRSGGISPELATLIRKNMQTVGLRADFHVTPFQDAIKELERGQFALYFGGYGGTANGYGTLLQLYGRSPVEQNVSRFKSPEYDREMETYLHTGDPARQAAAGVKMAQIAEAYGPMQPLVFRLENDFAQPWLQGFAPPLFDTYWKYLDIDRAKQAH